MQKIPAFQHYKVRDEYERWSKILGPIDPYEDRYTVGIYEVLHAHFLLIDYFKSVGEGVGGVGPKDINLLHSALSRQFVSFAGKPKYSERIDICATLIYGLIKNHPFHDANKRTAFLTSILHLQKIGRTPTVPGDQYEDFIVAIADNKLYEYDSIKGSKILNLDDEIAIISKTLQRFTRQIDLRNKLITYNELNTILAKRGLSLENPDGNKIDLIRLFDLDGKRLVKPVRIAHIGFHGWSKEVSRKDIRIIREASRLDASHGYDSQAFFKGLDDPLSLIKKYKEPLERLAFR